MRDLDQLTRDFSEHGFVLIEDLLVGNAKDELDSALTRFLEHIAPTMKKTERVHFSGWDGPVKSLGQMEDYDPFFAELPKRAEFLEIASALLVGEAIPFGVEYFARPPRNDAIAPSHQDNGYFCYKPPESLAFWIAVDEVTETNGGIGYASGSHRAGDLEHEFSGIHGFTQGLTDPEAQLAGYEEVMVELPAGGCAIHHSLCAHRSGPNPTDRNRRAIVLDYRTARAQRDQPRKDRQDAAVKKLLKEKGAGE
jgi:hypothetical protein